MCVELIKNLVEEEFKVQIIRKTRRREYVEARAMYYKLLLDKRKKNPYIEDILELYKEIFREQITDNKLLLTSYTNLIFYLNSQLKDNTLLKEHRQHIKNQLKTKS